MNKILSTFWRILIGIGISVSSILLRSVTHANSSHKTSISLRIVHSYSGTIDLQPSTNTYSGAQYLWVSDPNQLIALSATAPSSREISGSGLITSYTGSNVTTGYIDLVSITLSGGSGIKTLDAEFLKMFEPYSPTSLNIGLDITSPVSGSTYTATSTNTDITFSRDSWSDDHSGFSGYTIITSQDPAFLDATTNSSILGSGDMVFTRTSSAGGNRYWYLVGHDHVGNTTTSSVYSHYQTPTSSSGGGGGGGSSVDLVFITDEEDPPEEEPPPPEETPPEEDDDSGPVISIWIPGDTATSIPLSQSGDDDETQDPDIPAAVVTITPAGEPLPEFPGGPVITFPAPNTPTPDEPLSFIIDQEGQPYLVTPSLETLEQDPEGILDDLYRDLQSQYVELSAVLPEHLSADDPCKTYPFLCVPSSPRDNTVGFGLIFWGLIYNIQTHTGRTPNLYSSSQGISNKDGE